MTQQLEAGRYFDKSGAKTLFYLEQEAFEGSFWVRDMLLDLSHHSKWNADHSRRAGSIGGSLAVYCNFSHEDTTDIIRAGYLHDIGKLKIPERILDSSTLSPEEFEGVKAHPRVGFEMVKGEDMNVAQILVAHHEFFQQDPYPRKTPRVSADKILVEKQFLLALADTVEALKSQRSYKQSWSDAQVRAYLEGKAESSLVETALQAYTVIL